MAKILIVGAGMAGLSAAKILAAAEHEVRIYEALPRLGGRAFSTKVDVGGGKTAPFDWGAEAIEATADAEIWQIDDPQKIDKTRTETDPDANSEYGAVNDDVTIIPFAPGHPERNLPVKENGTVSTSANTRDVEKHFNATHNDDYFHQVDLRLGQRGDQDIAQRLSNFLFWPVISDAAEVNPPLGSIHNQVRSGMENQGYSRAEYDIKQDLGDKVQAWAKANNLDTLCTLNQSVLSVENDKSGPNVGKVVVRVCDLKEQKSREENFDAVLITAPTDRVRGGSESSNTDLSYIYLPELSELEVAPFRANPLACYFKLAISGLASIKDSSKNPKLVRPHVNETEFVTFETGYSAITLGRSSDGEIVYLHAAGDTGRVMSDNPQLAANALVHAIRTLNPQITDEEIAGCHIWAYDWNKVPSIGGSYSANIPGLWMSRDMLKTFKKGKIYYAGEACSTRWFGQLAGAMESGEATAHRMNADLT